jgi:transcriptional regulator with AAA-type ATPase domain
MNSADLVSFLQHQTCLSNLAAEVLEAIAAKLTEQTIAAEQTLVRENTEPEGIYIVRSGKLISNSSLESSQSSLLSGTVLNLYALLLNQPTQYQVKTISQTQVWYIDRHEFQELIQQYPQIAQAFSQQLATEVKELSEQLQFEQERQVTLRPYLVSKAKRGVIGKSRYATRLRSQIKQAAETRESVLLFGEPGLEKDNLAALIHFGSAYRRQPIIKIDCSKLQTSGAELFGRSGGKLGLIASLDQGTLILNNVHLLPQE